EHTQRSLGRRAGKPAGICQPSMMSTAASSASLSDERYSTSARAGARARMASMNSAAGIGWVASRTFIRLRCRLDGRGDAKWHVAAGDSFDVPSCGLLARLSLGCRARRAVEARGNGRVAQDQAKLLLQARI